MAKRAKRAKSLKRLCVYCGSSIGASEAYADAAKALAACLVENGIELIYGGADKGIMGVIANAVLHAGGQVTGVMPRALVEKEISHSGLTNLHIVDSMHERKALMATLADGFVALPGGYGTLEEIIEIVTWAQLGFHRKPVGLLNTSAYFDHLLAWLKHAASESFVRPAHRDMLIVADSPDTLLSKFMDYVPPNVEKWQDR